MGTTLSSILNSSTARHMVMFFLPKYVAKSSVNPVIFLDFLVSKYAVLNSRIHRCLPIVAITFHLGYDTAGNKRDPAAIVATEWIMGYQIMVLN